MNQEQKNLLLSNKNNAVVENEIENTKTIDGANEQRKFIGIKLATQLDVVIGITIQMSVLLIFVATLVFIWNYMAPQNLRWLTMDDLKDIKSILATIFAGYMAGRFKRDFNK